MQILRAGTNVTIANLKWVVCSAIIRGESDVRYGLSRTTQEGREERVVYPFEFDAPPTGRRRVELIDFGEEA